MTKGTITAVNSGTKRITYRARFLDFGDGTTLHVPRVGGYVWMGCVYAHGGPACSRNTIRMQTYNPAHLGEVTAAGGATRESWQVEYVEDASGHTLFHHYGNPTAGTGSRGSLEAQFSFARNVSAVIPDPDRNQIIVVWTGAENTIGAAKNLFYVLDVSQAVPASLSNVTLLVLVGALWTVGNLSRRRG
jgi:hypothetical protein